MRGLNPNFNPTKTERYVSPWTAVTASGGYTFTHNLSGKPDQVYLEYLCIATDQGYAVGEIIQPGTATRDPTTAPQGYGHTIKATETTIAIAYCQTSVEVVAPAGGGSANGIISTKWLMRVIAEKVTIGDVPDIIRVGLVPLKEFVLANGDADLVVDLLAHANEYDVFELWFTDVRCATDATQIGIRVSLDGGVTYKAGATDYVYQFQSTSDGTNSNTYTANDTAGRLGAFSTGTANDYETLDGVLHILWPHENDKRIRLMSNYHGINSVPNLITAQGGSEYKTNGTVTHIKLFPVAGNFKQGTFTLYGRRKVT